MDLMNDNKTVFPYAYAVKHNDLLVRMNSRSGGVFTALSDYILNRGGSVYGCALTAKLEAVHAKAVTKEERDMFRGSKYIQSNPGNTFHEAKQDLQDKKAVLYSGTACQIAALKAYLNDTDTSKLLLVDIVCHGVPSPKVFKSYINWIELKKKGKVSHIDFRNKKKYGWAEQVETVTVNGKEYDSRVFSNLFMRNHILRPSCYQCPYKNIVRPGDITIADYWGIEQAVPGFSDNKGVSLAIINNLRGREHFKAVEDSMEAVECSVKDCMQPSLLSPASKPVDRSEFWEGFHKKPFSYIVRKYASETWKAKLRLKWKGYIT